MKGHERRTDVFRRILIHTALLPCAAGLSLFGQTFEADEARARTGDAAAMTALARRYETGQGCPQDAGQALLWFKRAAARDNPDAMVALGDIYDEGKCVDQSMGTAVLWFRRASSLGSPGAMHRLGRMIEFGRGVRRDKDEAATWYRRAAELGYPQALTKMGEITGQAEWYRKAVSAGDPAAYAKLAATLSGDEAVAMHRRGAERGDPAAMYHLGLHEEAIDRARAARWLLRAAEAGYPAAMSRYAEYAAQGLGGVAQSDGEAGVWYRKAADGGDPAGLTWVGQGIEAKNPEAAMPLYERAAAAGYAPAMTRLALIRADCDLFRRAADGGDVDGMFHYATKCTPEDARGWLTKAGDRGHALALVRLGDVKRAAEAGHLPSMLEMAKKDAAWVRRAADAGEPEAMRMFAATIGDRGEAARWIQRSAEAGNRAAMFELASAYEKGSGVMADRAIAEKWYRAAATAGDARAMYRLGVLTSDMSWVRKAAEAEVPEAMCRMGETASDREEALRWFRKAGDLGNVNAWTRIGALTGDTAALERAAQAGDGEAKMRLGEMEARRGRYKQAYLLYRAAADAGYAPAMTRVGDCHFEGKGTWVSEVDAVNWYRRAVHAGDKDAMEKLKRLGKTL
jgi:TPR repeat protein